MNDYDSARIIDLMREEGYERTEHPEDADLLASKEVRIFEKVVDVVFSLRGRLEGELFGLKGPVASCHDNAADLVFTIDHEVVSFLQLADLVASDQVLVG